MQAACFSRPIEHETPDTGQTTAWNGKTAGIRGITGWLKPGLAPPPVSRYFTRSSQTPAAYLEAGDACLRSASRSAGRIIAEHLADAVQWQGEHDG